MTIIREERIGNQRLILGDCLAVMPTLGRFDAVVTDPPYGVDLGKTEGAGAGHGLKLGAYASYADSYENFVGNIVPRINAALDRAGRGAVFTGQHIHEQRKPDAIGGIYCPAASGRHCWGFKSILPILLYGVAPAIHLGSKATAISSTETVDRKTVQHPVPKPIGWMRWLVNLASLPGETILDPFMGSGTTLVACQRMGRHGTGIEIDPDYFEIACKRVDEAARQPDLLIQAPAPQPTQEALL